LEVQFEVLMKSAERAKERITELKSLALDVPVTFVDMAEASRLLEVFTEGAFASTTAMRMMADASAASGRNIQEVAFWYGRAYSMVKAGRPFGEAAMRLQEMGLLTGTARNQMEKLGSGGRNTAKVMATLNAEFNKFSGASARAALTWGGQISMWQDAWDQALDAVGNELMPFAKTKLTAVTEAVKRMIKDGTLAQWGKNILKVFEKVEASIRANVGPAFQFLQNKFRELQGAFSTKGIGGVAEVISRDLASAITQLGVTLYPMAYAVGAQLGMGIASGIAKGIKDGIMKKFSKDWTGGTLTRIGELAYDYAVPPTAKPQTRKGTEENEKASMEMYNRRLAKMQMPQIKNLDAYRQMVQSGQLQATLSRNTGPAAVRVVGVSTEAAAAIHQPNQSTGGF
jgi:hypothetical protein